MSDTSLGERFNEYDSKNEWPTLYNKIRNDSSTLHCNFKIKHAKLTENLKLNRYRDVLPYDHSRVILPSGLYINASHVPVDGAGRAYILTQGPLPDTAGHFWEMVWHQNSKAVIMLNRVMEKNQVKCHQYFPASSGENGRTTPNLIFGDFEIRLLDEIESKHYCLRNLLLIYKKDENQRKILHYQFNTWPDFGVPETTHDFLEFLYEVRKTNVLNPQLYGPPVIHCSAGIGRSGTFIIVDVALVIAQQTKNPSKIDIVKLVTDLRQYRMGLIQTADQLRFSWKAIVDALEDECWNDLLETTCIDADQEVPSEVIANGRPNYERLSANQMTDSNDSSFDETSSLDDAASTSKRRKSKTPNDERQSEERSAYDAQSTAAASSSNGVQSSSTTLQYHQQNEDDLARQSYEARLRKRQLRAKEMQEKIERIQAKLHQSNGWEKYKNYALGGAAVLVGGLFIYFYCKFM